MEKEIDRIGSSTTWGGINILNGAYSKASPIVFHIGPNSGDNLSFTMGYVRATSAATAQGTLGLSSDVLTRTKASAYITTVDAAISIVSSRRGNFGAVSNRLDSTITNIRNMRANILSAKGQIEDTDYAQESANLAKSSIMNQSAMAMVAQANQANAAFLTIINQ